MLAAATTTLRHVTVNRNCSNLHSLKSLQACCMRSAGSVSRDGGGAPGGGARDGAADALHAGEHERRGWRVWLGSWRRRDSGGQRADAVAAAAASASAALDQASSCCVHPITCGMPACLFACQHWREARGALPRHLHTQVGLHASLTTAHAHPIPAALRACLAWSIHRHPVLQADASEAAGRQNSATSTAASAAVPGEVLPLRRLHKRRAFTPTVEQVRHLLAR